MRIFAFYKDKIKNKIENKKTSLNIFYPLLNRRIIQNLKNSLDAYNEEDLTRILQ